MFPWFGVLEFTVQKKNPPWRLQSDHRRGVAGVLAESVGIDPKTRKGSSRLAIGAGNPTGSLSKKMAGAAGFDPTPQRFKGAHATITHSPYYKRKPETWQPRLVSIQRFRGHSAAVSISLRGITLWWESLGSNQVLGVFSAPQ